MGYFKSVSRKKKMKIMLIKYLVIILLVFLLINYLCSKIKLSQTYLEYLSFAFLGDIIIEEETESQPVFEEKKEPIVYIYNTHQTEGYRYEKLASYNIDYTVMLANYILEAYLLERGINSVVETNSMSEVLKANNLVYKQSYRGSRILMENAKAKYPSLKYYVDLHRDSSVYEKTMCEVNGKKYAKILFLIGLENENYEDNLAITNSLNEKLKAVDPCLSRGIWKKSGPGVDGVYNQDFDKNAILVELGGQYNYIDEVNNTLVILADILAEYIQEDV